MSIKRFLPMAWVLTLAMQPALAGSVPFIDNMPQLNKDPDRVGAMIWQKPGVDRAAYTRVMIEPITIFISPDSEYQGLSADELKAVSDQFANAITQTLEPAIPIVSKSGPGVMVLRAALTNVKIAKKKRGLLGYTPIGFVAGAAKEAVAGPSVTLKDASLEIEMLDSVSGERLGVLVDTAPKGTTQDTSWEAISKTFTFYAERFKSRMQAAK